MKLKRLKKAALYNSRVNRVTICFKFQKNQLTDSQKELFKSKTHLTQLIIQYDIFFLKAVRIDGNEHQIIWLFIEKLPYIDNMLKDLKRLMYHLNRHKIAFKIRGYHFSESFKI